MTATGEIADRGGQAAPGADRRPDAGETGFAGCRGLPVHGLTPADLQAHLNGAGYPAFRAGQVWQWLYRRFETDFDRMHNLPSALRLDLKQSFRAAPFTQRDAREAADGVVKCLLEAADGELVETVCIPAAARRTVCVSTQAGCALGCLFCATAKGGFARNLSAGEIVGQVIAAARYWNERPSHVVFMGMGEPLLNVEALLRSLTILNAPEGLGIAARRMTISTCGIVPGIQRLSTFGMQVELSVSLHAPEDRLRERLMPVNRRWPLTPLLAACRDYAKRTGRIITFEYTLVAGLNDQPDQARQLVARLRGLPCRVNLIPLSPIPEFEGRAPDEAAIQHFRFLIRRAGINVTVRQSRGASVDAACGQLRRQAHARPTALPDRLPGQPVANARPQTDRKHRPPPGRSTPIFMREPDGA